MNACSDQPVFGTIKYPISPQRRTLIYVVCALLGGVPLLIVLGALRALDGAPPGDGAEGVVFVGVLMLLITTPFVIYMLRWGRRLSLTLSIEGIKLFNNRQRPLVPWTDATHFVTQPLSAGLVLKDAPQGLLTPVERQASGVRIGGVPLTPDLIGGAVQEGRFLDLRPFAGHFKRGDLLHQIRAFAPHLVEVKDEEPSTEESRKQRKKGIIGLVGITAVVIASFSAGVFIDGEVSHEASVRIDKFVYGTLGLLFGLMGIATLTTVARARWREGLYAWFTLWTLFGGTQALVGFYVLFSQFA